MERAGMEAQEVEYDSHGRIARVWKPSDRELRQQLAAYKAAATSAYEDGARAGVKAGYDAGYKAGWAAGVTQAIEDEVPKIAEMIGAAYSTINDGGRT